MKLVKVLVDPDDQKFILRKYIGDVDLTPVGLGVCKLSVSVTGAQAMVEFNDGTIVGLDVQAFLKECVSVYKDLKNKKEAVSHE